MSNQLVVLHSVEPSARNNPPLDLSPTTHALEGNGPVGQMHLEMFSALPNGDIRPTFL